MSEEPKDIQCGYRKALEEIAAASSLRRMEKPTIAELESILSDPNPKPVYFTPSGEVFAGRDPREVSREALSAPCGCEHPQYIRDIAGYLSANQNIGIAIITFDGAWAHAKIDVANWMEMDALLARLSVKPESTAVLREIHDLLQWADTNTPGPSLDTGEIVSFTKAVCQRLIDTAGIKPE